MKNKRAKKPAKRKTIKKRKLKKSSDKSSAILRKMLKKSMHHTIETGEIITLKFGPIPELTEDELNNMRDHYFDSALCHQPINSEEVVDRTLPDGIIEPSAIKKTPTSFVILEEIPSTKAKFWVAFEKPTNFFERLISHCDRGPYCHCELVFPNGLSFSSWPFRGVDFSDEFQKRMSSNWTFIPIYLFNGLAEKKANELCGRPYNYIGVLKFLRPFQWIRDARKPLFCSEAVAEVINYASLMTSASSEYRIGKLDLCGPDQLSEKLKAKPEIPEFK